MDLDPVILSRIQFAFVVSFHIIFPAFTIGLAAWLATIEGARLATGNPIYRRVFDFWLKVFAVSFGMGVVTGIVMAFQFGTNWGVLAERMGSIQGPLLGYEGFTAFMLEATFFGVMLLGRERVSPRFYFFACCMVSLGTMFSSFWILANNSWMQVPVGYSIFDGRIIPADWWAITTGPIMRVRWPHMLLAAFLTTGMCVIATGAWYVLRGMHRAEAREMLHWGLGLVAVLIPVQLFFGHLTGEYVLKHQPAKFAAIEARWKTQQPASEVLIAIPDSANERNLLRSRCPSSAASSPRATGPHVKWGWKNFRRKTGRRWSSRSSRFASWSAWGSSCSPSRGSETSCGSAAGSRAHAGSFGAHSCPSRPASSPSSADGSPPRSGASRGLSTACSAPRMQ